MGSGGELIPYGIQAEDSQIRAHVSVVCRTIYAFPTINGLAAVERWAPPERDAFQANVEGPTARGWLVHPDQIEDLRRLRFKSWPRWSEFRVDSDTSTKGRLAVECVCDCLRCGRFPLWINTEEDDDVDVQVAGTDLIVRCNVRIQIKCDFRGGDRPEGTGNLFLQFAERNPLARH